MNNFANEIQNVESDVATAVDEIRQFANSTEEAAMNGNGVGFLEGLIGEDGEIPVYPEDTLAPTTCAARMQSSVKTYWDLLYAMVALGMITILLPYFFVCCSKIYRYKIASWIYHVSGLVKIVCGLLLATALMPQCPLDCGEWFCSLNEFNPGPLYGCVVLFVGLIWLVKGCTLSMAVRRAQAAAAEKPEYSKADTTAPSEVGTGYRDHEDDKDDKKSLGMAEIL